MSNDENNKKSFGIAKVNWAGPDFWCVYADGYRRAAELLIEGVKEIYETNTVIFPILALYRQYVELSLKEVIAYGQYLDGKGTTPDTHHDLMSLWASAKSYIAKYYQSFEETHVIRIQKLVSELYDLDPTSQGSRYPYVKPKDKSKGARLTSFSDAPMFLNLDLLYREIRELAELLNDVTSYLAISQDLEAEARSICQSEVYQS